MSMRAVVAALLVGIAALAYFAWSKSTSRVPAQGTETTAPGAVAGGEPGSMPPAGGDAGSGAPTMPPAAGGGSNVVIQSGGDPGLAWTVPTRWRQEAGSPMRLATYVIPTVPSDNEDGRCAVYYFGVGQGGGSDANIHRWIDEFEGGGKPERAATKVAGLPVERVRVRGTYLAHAGMGSGGENAKPNFELMGAIVEGPSGSVFFKLTGPGKTIDAAAGEFDRMIASLSKK